MQINRLLFLNFLFFFITVIPGKLAPALRGIQLEQTTSKGSTYSFYHRIILTKSQETQPPDESITLSPDDYKSVCDTFVQKRTSRWTRKQKAPYIQKLVAVAEKGVSRTVRLEPPAPNTPVDVQFSFETEPYPILNNTTTAQVRITFVTTSLKIDPYIYNLVKSIVLPDGFFTRNLGILSALGLAVTAQFGLQKLSAHRERAQAEEKLTQFRADLLKSLEERFSTGDGEGFHASADNLTDIPSSAKIVVIGAHSANSLKRLTPKLTNEK